MASIKFDFLKLRSLKLKIHLPIIVLLLLLSLLYVYFRYVENKQYVKIGVLHSLTGTMAASETPLVDAVQFAVEEINDSGGLNGIPVKIIVADCRSDANFCAQEAQRLISIEKVNALFGCWTSDCRIAVKNVVEKYNLLLFYPLQYEGLEKSSNIIYTGSTPNQQIMPMVIWALQNKGKRYYLIGSDYIFPRIANFMIKEVLNIYGGYLMGERYLPMGSKDMAIVVNEISALKPDFVVNTLNGDSNTSFFHALYAAGIKAAKIPVFSTSIAEVELQTIGPTYVEGHYAAKNYFQSLDTHENKIHVEAFKNRFGKNRVLDDPMESSYVGVILWANAVREISSTDSDILKSILMHQTFHSPQGIVSIDYNTQHLWQKVFIGQAEANGQFNIVWKTDQSVRPVPYPVFHNIEEWKKIKEYLSGVKR